MKKIQLKSKIELLLTEINILEGNKKFPENLCAFSDFFGLKVYQNGHLYNKEIFQEWDNTIFASKNGRKIYIQFISEKKAIKWGKREN